MKRLSAVLIFAFVLAAPSAANAATASVTGGVLTFTAGSGERNDVGIEQVPGGYELQENTAEITPGAGCAATAAENTVRCTGVTSITVSLADRGDLMRVVGNPAAPIAYAGGSARDLVLYLSAAGSLTASNDGVANDGPDGGDNIGTDVERIIGTQFADTLSAGPLGADIEGNDGDDTLTGGDADDTLRAAYVEDSGTESGAFYGYGTDIVTCGGGNDFVLSDTGDTVSADCEVVAVNTFGSSGDSFLVRGTSRWNTIGPLPYGWGPATVRAYGGNDTVRTREVHNVYGGRGNDRIIGFDQAKQVFRGERGNDKIDVRDKSGANRFNRDVVRCGPGRDLVYANRNDRVARDCERVKRRR